MRHTTLCLGTLLSLCVLGSLARATTYIVPSGDYPTIQSAIDAASDGDSVLVEPGTYTGIGNRDLSFGGTELVLVSNGGAESTVIDCEGLGRGVYFANGEGNGAVVDGFTIRNGFAPDGGGIACEGEVEPVIRNCLLEENEAVDGGGGIYCLYGASPTIQGCTIVDNVAEVGGGVCGFEASPTITACELSGNVAGAGGGIFGYRSSPTITSSRISGNTAELGGGCRFGLDSSPLILGSLVTGNRGESGAGLFFSNSPNPTIISTTIAANSASQAGGGIRSGHSTIVLERSILWGNCATSGGPAVYFDGPGELSVECCAIDSAGISDPDQVLFLGEQVFTDPLFCDAEECTDAPTSDGEWAIDANSPCVAERSPCGQLIGARGIGCESPTPTIQISWGQMKARFGR